MEIAGTMPDPTLDTAVASIMKKISDDEGSRVDVSGNDREPVDAREDREERDTIERQGTSDLEQAEREDRAANAEDEGEAVADDAGADDQFIELPASEDGKEPERIPLTEALEAVQKLRQMDGDIATAVIRVESEAQQKQDQITSGLMQAFDAVIQHGEVALKAMGMYLPQAPDPIMLDRNSGYYDPEAYHTAKIYHENYLAHAKRIEHEIGQARQGKTLVGGHVDSTFVARETERAARYIPEFKDETTREAKKGEILSALQSKYGFTKADLDEITDHRAWRALNDLANTLTTQKKAPEIRKAVQEKAPKIVKGRANPNRDSGNGRFVSDAKKELKETGSESAFAKKLLRSGFLDKI